jgi:hypothetical protein
MSKNKRRGRQQRSHGGSAGGGGNKQGKIMYDSGEEPAFIRQFKARTGYQAPSTAEDKVESCLLFVLMYFIVFVY